MHVNRPSRPSVVPHLVGAQVEVYWGSSTPQSTNSTMQGKNWFQATIIDARERKSIEDVLVATIRYDAVDSFPIFHQEVIVINQRDDQPILRCVLTGHCLRWRWKSPTPVSGDVEVLASECAMLPYLRNLTDRSNGRQRRVVFSRDADVASLESRVQYLEASVLMQRQILSRLHDGVRPETLANFERPLMYIRIRLNELLQQSPRVTKASPSASATGIVLDSIRCSADCSLSEFESICLHILSSPRSSIFFDPLCSASDIPRLHEDILSIHFGSLREMFRVIGITSDSIIAKSLVKATRGRDKSSPKMCRVLGELICAGRNEPDPMCICVANVLSEGTCTGMPDKVPILIREDTSWNVMDQQYEEALSFRVDTKSYCHELRSKYGLHEQATLNPKRPKNSVKKGRATRVPSFQLRWERCGIENNRQLLCSPCSAAEVAGRLHVDIPAVIIGENALCGEVLQICDEKRLIQLMSQCL